MSQAHHAAARGFPAFPARRGGRAGGQSFWARQWTAAVEDVWPEQQPLKQGRSLARSGRTGPLTVSPGRVDARTEEGERTCTTRLTLTVLDDDAWDALWEKAADRPAETEALLAGELPEDLLEAVEDARVRMLPGYGDLDADCDCDTLGHPCPHAIALAYQLSWLLDDDPWLLPLIRGRSTQQAVEDLKSALLLRALAGDDADDPDDPDDLDDAYDVLGSEPSAPAGTPDPDAYAAQRAAYARPATALPALPPLPEPPTVPEEPLTGIEADPLDRLAADAAVRARELLAHLHGFDAAPPEPLDEWQDTVRLAATHPDPRAVERLRAGCGRPADELDRAVAAWHTGGRTALEVLERSWIPTGQQTARARTALAVGWADELPRIDIDGNHWTVTGRGLQLRLGHDGRWYPYRRRDAVWWPVGPSHGDPAEALSDLLAPVDQEAPGDLLAPVDEEAPGDGSGSG
ncbi:SWIM zinc finger family protein [Streptomyces sp. NPDC085937]|uniref:SWIM zinc finger family protein n=1 Tax=Streptomyces sp. NPDC085937 TaxID=3365742 RepID=UPI0037D887F9